MEVFLNQDIEKLGKAQTVVYVKDGFARNFLIPRGLAVAMTVSNLKKLEQQKKKKLEQIEKVKKDSEDLKSRLEDISLTMPALAKDDENLYANVNAQDIAGALKDEGFDIEKSSIKLEQEIKALGIYEVFVKLHPEVSAKVKVWVVKK